MSDTAVKNAFDLFGLPQTASEFDILTARRAVVRANHPDLVQNERAKADNRLAEVNAAFDVLIPYVRSLSKARNALNAARKTGPNAKATARKNAQRKAERATQSKPSEESRNAPQDSTPPQASRADTPPPRDRRPNPAHQSARRNFQAGLDAVTSPRSARTRTAYA